MDRRELTAERVNEAERMIVLGFRISRIAKRLGITQYVLRLLKRHAHLRRVGSLRPDSLRKPKAQIRLEATTIRQIQRMLAVGMLSHAEIARQAGVSDTTVDDVAAGKRIAVSLAVPVLSDWELFLNEPIRCRGCAGLVSVIPCRACMAHLVQRIEQFSVFSSPRKKIRRKRFTDWQNFGVLVGTINQSFGVPTMPDLLPLLSAEISAFLSSQDKREFLITRAEKLFDQLVEPIDLPGPDQLIDPVLRSMIRPLVGRVYDEAIKKLEVPANAA
jgi:hypothetical protein